MYGLIVSARLYCTIMIFEKECVVVRKKEYVALRKKECVVLRKKEQNILSSLFRLAAFGLHTTTMIGAVL